MDHAGGALGLFALLGERFLLNFLRKVNVKTMLRLMETSKSFYCCCNYEKLWKRICIKRWDGKVTNKKKRNKQTNKQNRP
jgi:hypothetical protein